MRSGCGNSASTICSFSRDLEIECRQESAARRAIRIVGRLADLTTRGDSSTLIDRWRCGYTLIGMGSDIKRLLVPCMFNHVFFQQRSLGPFATTGGVTDPSWDMLFVDESWNRNIHHKKQKHRHGMGDEITMEKDTFIYRSFLQTVDSDKEETNSRINVRALHKDDDNVLSSNDSRKQQRGPRDTPDPCSH